MADQRADTYLFPSSFSNNISHGAGLWSRLNSGMGTDSHHPAACFPLSPVIRELKEDVSVGNSMISFPAWDHGLRHWLCLLGCHIIFFVRLSVNFINLPLTPSEYINGDHTMLSHSLKGCLSSQCDSSLLPDTLVFIMPLPLPPSLGQSILQQ